MDLTGQTNMTPQQEAREEFRKLIGVPGLFNPDTLLTLLSLELQNKDVGFQSVLWTSADLAKLSDDQAMAAIKIMPTLQIERIKFKAPLRPPPRKS